jgi:hypothetical protein
MALILENEKNSSYSFIQASQTLWSRVLLEKLTERNLPPFMESEDLLLCSQAKT